MVGIDQRTTMDMDTTIKNLVVDQDKIQKIIEEISNINVDDGVSFELAGIKKIRDESIYDDFRVSLMNK